MAEVGVFYDACAEWAGEYEPFENVGQLLDEAQISHMIIPEDVLRMENCKEGRLKAGHVSCRYWYSLTVNICRKRCLTGADMPGSRA